MGKSNSNQAAPSVAMVHSVPDLKVTIDVRKFDMKTKFVTEEFFLEKKRSQKNFVLKNEIFCFVNENLIYLLISIKPSFTPPIPIITFHILR